MNRIKEGFAGYINPFSGSKHFVSLKPEDVYCLVFWSKDFTPFMDSLTVLEEKGYRFYFNYTVNGFPSAFEKNVPETGAVVENLRQLSGRYSPEHINWRYDPVIISDITEYEYHIRNFRRLASEFKGHVKRCYFSYVTRYGKVKRNFDALKRSKGLRIAEPSTREKVEFTRRLTEIAGECGISMYACCGDYLLGGGVHKARCIDGDAINGLFTGAPVRFKRRPTRKECGCTESYDIGAYDTCPHGCIYCYANAEKTNADRAYSSHDKHSAFLGKAKEVSDRWVSEFFLTG